MYIIEPLLVDIRHISHVACHSPSSQPGFVALRSSLRSRHPRTSDLARESLQEWAPIRSQKFYKSITLVGITLPLITLVLQGSQFSWPTLGTLHRGSFSASTESADTSIPQPSVGLPSSCGEIQMFLSVLSFVFFCWLSPTTNPQICG